MTRIHHRPTHWPMSWVMNISLLISISIFCNIWCWLHKASAVLCSIPNMYISFFLLLLNTWILHIMHPASYSATILRIFAHPSWACCSTIWHPHNKRTKSSGSIAAGEQGEQNQRGLFLVQHCIKPSKIKTINCIACL